MKHHCFNYTPNISFANMRLINLAFIENESEFFNLPIFVTDSKNENLLQKEFELKGSFYRSILKTAGIKENEVTNLRLTSTPIKEVSFNA